MVIEKTTLEVTKKFLFKRSKKKKSFCNHISINTFLFFFSLYFDIIYNKINFYQDDIQVFTSVLKNFIKDSNLLLKNFDKILNWKKKSYNFCNFQKNEILFINKRFIKIKNNLKYIYSYSKYNYLNIFKNFNFKLFIFNKKKVKNFWNIFHYFFFILNEKRIFKIASSGFWFNKLLTFISEYLFLNLKNQLLNLNYLKQKNCQLILFSKVHYNITIYSKIFYSFFYNFLKKDFKFVNILYFNFYKKNIQLFFLLKILLVKKKNLIFFLKFLLNYSYFIKFKFFFDKKKNNIFNFLNFNSFYKLKNFLIKKKLIDLNWVVLYKQKNFLFDFFPKYSKVFNNLFLIKNSIVLIKNKNLNLTTYNLFNFWKFFFMFSFFKNNKNFIFLKKSFKLFSKIKKLRFFLKNKNFFIKNYNFFQYIIPNNFIKKSIFVSNFLKIKTVKSFNKFNFLKHLKNIKNIFEFSKLNLNKHSYNKEFLKLLFCFYDNNNFKNSLIISSNNTIFNTKQHYLNTKFVVNLFDFVFFNNKNLFFTLYTKSNYNFWNFLQKFWYLNNSKNVLIENFFIKYVSTLYSFNNWVDVQFMTFFNFLKKMLVSEIMEYTPFFQVILMDKFFVKNNFDWNYLIGSINKTLFMPELLLLKNSMLISKFSKLSKFFLIFSNVIIKFFSSLKFINLNFRFYFSKFLILYFNSFTNSDQIRFLFCLFKDYYEGSFLNFKIFFFFQKIFWLKFLFNNTFFLTKLIALNTSLKKRNYFKILKFLNSSKFSPFKISNLIFKYNFFNYYSNLPNNLLLVFKNNSNLMLSKIQNLKYSKNLFSFIYNLYNVQSSFLKKFIGFYNSNLLEMKNNLNFDVMLSKYKNFLYFINSAFNLDKANLSLKVFKFFFIFNNNLLKLFIYKIFNFSKNFFEINTKIDFSFFENNLLILLKNILQLPYDLKTFYTFNNFKNFLNNFSYSVFQKNSSNLGFFLILKWFILKNIISSISDKIVKVQNENFYFLKKIKYINKFSLLFLNINNVMSILKNKFICSFPKNKKLLKQLKQNNFKVFLLKKKYLFLIKKNKKIIKKIILLLNKNNSLFKNTNSNYKNCVKKKKLYNFIILQKNLTFKMFSNTTSINTNSIKFFKINKNKNILKKKIMFSNNYYKDFYNNTKIYSGLVKKNLNNSKTVLNKKSGNWFLKNKNLSVFSKLKFGRIIPNNTFQNKLKLFWDKKNSSLQNKLFLKKKSRIKKYIWPIFYTEFKKKLFFFKKKILKNFLFFTRFYRIKKKQVFLNKKNVEIFYASRVFNLGIYGEPKTFVKQFIFQRRRKKEGFLYWQKFASKWLRFSLFRNRINRFYFTPLRTKRWISTKKQKYLQIYKQLITLHPRIGKWSTLGLVGNGFARNSLFIKKKILLRIFSNFYKVRNFFIFKKIMTKYSNITSKFNNDLTNILKIFEQRLDIIVFRSGFVLNIDLARLLVLRGYIYLNFFQKKNIFFRTQIGDFVAVSPNFRKIFFEVFAERYESFRKLYLNRFYKTPYINVISSYLTKILTTLTQMQGKKQWITNLASVRTLLEDYNIWTANSTIKNLYTTQLNFEINSIQKVDKENRSNYKPLNWFWFKKSNLFLSDKKSNFKFFFLQNKVKSLKKLYSHNILNLIFTRLNIGKEKKIYNFLFLKSILKDLLIQTWENFPKNLIINIRFRFCYIFQYPKINLISSFKDVEMHGRITFSTFRWFSKNI